MSFYSRLQRETAKKFSAKYVTGITEGTIEIGGQAKELFQEIFEALATLLKRLADAILLAILLACCPTLLAYDMLLFPVAIAARVDVELFIRLSFIIHLVVFIALFGTGLAAAVAGMDKSVWGLLLYASMSASVAHYYVAASGAELSGEDEE